GSGWVAITTDGPPLMLDVAEAPTFADAQAAVCWSSGVTSELKTDVNFKTMTGRASGETVQLAFGGQGWLLVQPSEGRFLPTVG
ncbi:MAG: AIM24 family protein, partial [Solirubrobacterales bacterium]